MDDCTEAIRLTPADLQAAAGYYHAVLTRSDGEAVAFGGNSAAFGARGSASSGWRTGGAQCMGSEEPERLANAHVEFMTCCAQCPLFRMAHFEPGQASLKALPAVRCLLMEKAASFDWVVRFIWLLTPAWI